MRRNEARTGSVHQDEGLGDNLSFEKRMAKSSFASLTVPAQFVRQHGDKFQQFVILQSEVGGHLWPVKASVCFPHGRPQVAFTRGWKAFVVFNGFVEGDRMTFTLVAKSKFKVYIARSGENSKAWPRLLTLESSLKDDSQGRPKKLLRSLEDDSQGQPRKLLQAQYFVDLTEESELRCDGLVAKDCEAVKAEIVVHSISNAAAAAAGSSLSSSSDMDSHFFEPVQATAPLPFSYS